MIMLGAKARPGPADDPGARAIPAAVRAEPVDVKGDFDAVGGAMADVHHHRLAAHIGIGVLVARETAGIGLAAPRRKRVEEGVLRVLRRGRRRRSEEHTSELQSLMRISYAVFCLKKKKQKEHKDK